MATPVKQILNNLSHDRARLLLERDEAQRKFKRDSDYELKHLDTHNPLIFVNQKYEPEEIDVNSLLVCTDSDADLSVQPNFGIEETQEFKPALEELVQKINGKICRNILRRTAKTRFTIKSICCRSASVTEKACSFVPI